MADLKRRQFLLSAAAGAGLVTTGGAIWISMSATDLPINFDTVIAQLESMRGKTLVTSGQWSPAKVFHHNAQSIDYSLTGFPLSKGKFFQAIIGKTAFAVFSAKKAMKHGLAEPIPGAPEIADGGNTDEAIDALLTAIARFRGFSGALQPHFAYGDLSKKDYEAAHVLHFMNHMSEIRIA